MLSTACVVFTVGILSYLELAPLLAERMAAAELEILERKFAKLAIAGLLLRLLWAGLR